ncbi:hypothetical protein EYR41_006109 [Orbilia oligospora]|uniref:F-box domain-containing protein n=1 Tax=Orbilia oligospora TaxID=2813651 RepID=A0A8H2HKP9_ORBOL|nr:hypothetical protein EYR41_006109 [Orbilia oligospora]
MITEKLPVELVLIVLFYLKWDELLNFSYTNKINRELASGMLRSRSRIYSRYVMYGTGPQQIRGKESGIFNGIKWYEELGHIVVEDLFTIVDVKMLRDLDLTVPYSPSTSFESIQISTDTLAWQLLPPPPSISLSEEYYLTLPRSMVYPPCSTMPHSLCHLLPALSLFDIRISDSFGDRELSLFRSNLRKLKSLKHLYIQSKLRGFTKHIELIRSCLEVDQLEAFKMTLSTKMDHLAWFAVCCSLASHQNYPPRLHVFELYSEKIPFSSQLNEENLSQLKSSTRRCAEGRALELSELTLDKMTLSVKSAVASPLHEIITLLIDRFHGIMNKAYNRTNFRVSVWSQDPIYDSHTRAVDPCTSHFCVRYGQPLPNYVSHLQIDASPAGGLAYEYNSYIQ